MLIKLFLLFAICSLLFAIMFFFGCLVLVCVGLTWVRMRSPELPTSLFCSDAWLIFGCTVVRTDSREVEDRVRIAVESKSRVTGFGQQVNVVQKCKRTFICHEGCPHPPQS